VFHKTVTRLIQADQPVAGYFFFRSMYVSSAITKDAKTMTSEKEKFIDITPNPGLVYPTTNCAVQK